MKLPGDSKVNQKKSCIESEFDPLTMNTFQQRPKLKTNIIANSDGEGSDSDSYSSDDEIDVPERNIINSVNDSNSCKELTDQLNNLSVSEQSKSSQIVEVNDFSPEQNSIDSAKTDEKLIPRSPIYNDNKSTRTLVQPYSLDCRRRSCLQNGGQIVAENPTFVDQSNQINSSQSTIIPQSVRALNLNIQTTIIVQPPESESPPILIPLDELKQFAEDKLRELSADEVAEVLGSEHPIEFTSSSDHFENSLPFLNGDTEETDSAYFSGNDLSPVSSNGSPSVTPNHETVFSNDSYSPNCQDFDTEPTIDTYMQFLSQADEVNKPVIHLSSNSSNHLPSVIMQNKAIHPFAKNRNSTTTAAHYLQDNRQPTNLAPTSTSFLMPKPCDLRIQPMGLIVYDIHMSASQRLDDMAKHLESIYNEQYIHVVTVFKDNPEQLKMKLFTLLKEERCGVDVLWLLKIYVRIKYIDSVGKEEFVRILTSKHDGLSLLYIACMKHPDLPLVARYIAEVMVKHNKNVNEVYNDNNSLMHELAYKGGTHVQLLAELLQMKTNINHAVFDVNCRNNNLQTSLHCAVVGHSSQNSCYTTIKHLVDHGAEILQDINGKTPLHYAILKGCGPIIVKHLLPLSASNIIDLKDTEGNTALHLAYKTFPETKQEIISVLLANNANQKVQNLNGELPCLGMNKVEGITVGRISSFILDRLIIWIGNRLTLESDPWYYPIVHKNHTVLLGNTKDRFPRCLDETMKIESVANKDRKKKKRNTKL